MYKAGFVKSILNIFTSVSREAFVRLTDKTTNYEKIQKGSVDAILYGNSSYHTSAGETE